MVKILLLTAYVKEENGLRRPKICRKKLGGKTRSFSTNLSANVDKISTLSR
jgi:hypothetical protein